MKIKGDNGGESILGSDFQNRGLWALLVSEGEKAKPQKEMWDYLFP